MTEWEGESDLWEHQGRVLTVGDLRRALVHADPMLPVRVELYDGAGVVRVLAPMELGPVGVGPAPTAVVLTVIDEG